MTKIKRLYAIHTDHNDNVYRTKIAEGTTADFADAIGFTVEEYDETYEQLANNKSSGSQQSLGLNGIYPVILGDSYSKLEGKLLTLCDATFTNKEQREAFKSMVRETMWTMYNSETALLEYQHNQSEPNWIVKKYVDLANLDEDDLAAM